MVISSGLASMTELSEVLSTEDVYILMEIHAIDRHNQRPRKE